MKSSLYTLIYLLRAGLAMEHLGEQMMARIMASGVIMGDEERRRGEAAMSAGPMGRITPLGRINEDEEERSPIMGAEVVKTTSGGIAVSGEDKLVVIKDGKVIEVETGEVLMDGGEKVRDLEGGKVIELSDGKVVAFDGGKLLEYSNNYNLPDPEAGFDKRGRYVVGEEFHGKRYTAYDGDPQFIANTNPGGGVGTPRPKYYDKKIEMEEESYDNITQYRQDSNPMEFEQPMAYPNAPQHYNNYVVHHNYPPPPHARFSGNPTNNASNYPNITTNATPCQYIQRNP